MSDEQLTPDAAASTAVARLAEAAQRFAAAAVGVEDHEGPRSGIEYEQKVSRWRSAYAKFVAAARQIPGESA